MMTDVTEAPNEQMVNISVRWPGGTLPPPVPANQFALQFSPGPDGAPDGVVLSIGYVIIPLTSGTPEEQRKQVQELEGVDITLVGRFLLTRDRAGELSQALSKAVDTWDSGDNGEDGSEQ
jgi:hypothetical protein